MKEEMERRRKVKELVERFKKEGVPYPLPRIEDVETGRE